MSDEERRSEPPENPSGDPGPRSRDPDRDGGSGSVADGLSGGIPEVDGELDRALALVRFLRRHCPWDAAQTPESLMPHLLEESHEVVDAVRSDDAERLEGELGDLLLNLAFQVVLAEEEGDFDAASVARRLEEKMKRRHPHLFGLGEREDWERLKARERGSDGALAELAEGLDPLLRAHRIQDRVSGVGFDWSEPMGAWRKVAEELDEVRTELERVRADGTEAEPEDPERADLDEELGDLLFAVVNLIRLSGAHSLTALEAANRKFTHRFQRLESLAAEREIDLASASLETLDSLWDELKDEEDEVGDGSDG